MAHKLKNMLNKELTPNTFNTLSEGFFPGELGIVVLDISEGKMKAEMPIKGKLFAPNGYLHAGSIVTLADSIAGYSTIAHLPENGKSFTTLELKSNFIGSVKEGVIECNSIAEHMGKTTQVWRVEVVHQASRKKLAIFSCTQLILY